MLDSLCRGGVPVLVFATVLAAFDGCSNDNLPGPAANADARTTGGAGGNDRGDAADANDASAGAGGSIPPIIGEPDARVVDVACFDAGAIPDPQYPFPLPPRRLEPCCYTYVDLPPEGTPARIDAICSDVADDATTSGWAARATLSGSVRYSTAGDIEIAPALADHVVGLPTVAIVDTSHPEWAHGVLTTVRTKAFGGFEFDASWPDVAPPFPSGSAITLELTFVVRCNVEGGAPDAGSPTTRTVKALTHLMLCAPYWIHSGEPCIRCGGPPVGDLAPN
jgi:hypothetical protein